MHPGVFGTTVGTGVVLVACLLPASVIPYELGLTLRAAQPARAQALGLKIVVIAGEDAVNVIQQKTAVAPVVEVRDRNDLPVPGAVVTFTLGGGKSAAFAGGAQTLTVTTNAAGQAAAGALSPLASGPVQIQVTAAFQGQTAVATIAQTNVVTAAQAAGASGAGGSSAGGTTAGGAGGGGGGGLSGLMIAAIAGGVGAGALVAVRPKGDDANSGGSAAVPQPSDSSLTFTFNTSLSAIAQCPLYVGQQGPGVGPFAFDGLVNRDGTFAFTFSVQTPAAQLTGRFTATEVTATFSCLGGGGPGGNLAATGAPSQYQGTWNWGGQGATVVVRPGRLSGSGERSEGVVDADARAEDFRVGAVLLPDNVGTCGRRPLAIRNAADW